MTEEKKTEQPAPDSPQEEAAQGSPELDSPKEAAQAESGAASESAGGNDEIGELLKQVSTLQDELQQRKDEVLRGRAELENYRKRMQREREEIRKTATSGLIEDLLPLLDNLKLGLQSAEQHPEAKVVTEGFSMVFSMFKNTLASHGLKELEPKGETFDPNFHECVSHQPSDTVEEDKVMEVIRAGYQLGDRLLRPATVVVSSGKAKPTDQEPATSKTED